MDEIKIKLTSDNTDLYEKIKNEMASIASRRLHYISNGIPNIRQEFIVANDDVVRYYKGTYRVFFTAKLKPYLVNISSCSFSFIRKSGVIANHGTTFKNVGNAIIEINKILGVEWFNNYNKEANYNYIQPYLMYNKTILQKVWSKKITNPESLIKFYSKTILRLKNISWKKCRLYLAKIHGMYSVLEMRMLRLIDEWVINPDLLIDKMVEYQETHNNLMIREYFDYINQIAAFEIKSNVGKWSLKRFNEEHSKLSLMLMEEELNEKAEDLLFDDEYNKYLPKNIKCFFINSEKKCFKEAQIMHNCLYTNYWGVISNIKYFAISINDKVYGKATLGIEYDIQNDCYIVDQIRGIKNCDCNAELAKTMKEWTSNNQELFKEIAKKYGNKLVNAKKHNYGFELPF